jgi:transposase
VSDEDHPVLAAIAAERERLREARKVHEEEAAAKIQEELAGFDDELAALDTAEMALRGAMGDDAPKRDRPEQSSPKPKPVASKPPSRKGSPGPASSRAVEQAQRDERVHAILRSGGEISSGEVAKTIEISDSQANTSLKRLEKAGKATRTGQARWTRWSAAEGERQAVSEGPGEREVGNAEVSKDGSLEGRILQSCMVAPATLPELIERMAPEEPVRTRTAVGGLVRERELRTNHKNGQTVYRFAG